MLFCFLRKNSGAQIAMGETVSPKTALSYDMLQKEAKQIVLRPKATPSSDILMCLYQVRIFFFFPGWKSVKYVISENHFC